MKKFFTLLTVLFLCALLVSSSAWGQTLLLEENFGYPAGDSLTTHGWTAHSSGSINTILVNNGGLSYTGYAESGIENAAYLNGTGEDDNRTFTSQNTGTLYTSFLVNFSNATTGSTEYFLNLNASTFYGKVYAKKSGSTLAFGLSKGSETATFTGFDYFLDTTYLLILKYQIVSGSSNDTVSLFVETSGVPASEPSTPTIGPLAPASTDPSTLNAIALRQGAASTMVLLVDGIRIGTSWTQAPLPVELTSFTATTLKSNVLLTWSTATEVQNAGFEVEKKTVENLKSESSKSETLGLGLGTWNKIGFVEGAGASNSPKLYTFTDANAGAGRYAYRLKQINLDGSYKTYQETEVQVALSPAQYTLSQNYPNPFNPSTMLSFAVHTPQRVSLKVFNLLGQEVATLFNGMAEANVLYKVAFNAAGLPSGVYFSVMNADENTQMKRMMLIK